MDGQTPYERAHAASLVRCPETCPAIDEALRTAQWDLEHLLSRCTDPPIGAVDDVRTVVTVALAGAVKVRVRRLRSALVAACEELERLREENERLRQGTGLATFPTAQSAFPGGVPLISAEEAERMNAEPDAVHRDALERLDRLRRLGDCAQWTATAPDGAGGE